MTKSIMVQLTGDPSDEAVLETAYLIARLFHAHIEGVHVSPSWTEFAASLAAQSLDSAISPVEVISAFEENAQNAEARAKEQFDRLCKRWDIGRASLPISPERITAHWRALKGSEETVTVAEARFYDLVVVGRSPDAMTASLVLHAGRPVLVAPAKAPGTLAPVVAVAWKETPEAARALTAAMPLIAQAKKVLLIGVDEGSGAEGSVESTSHMTEMLGWHFVTAESHCVNAIGRSVADAILQTAQAQGADVLVMGAYGHSRLREFILGGVTREILRDCPLPVFLFH